jgi:SAM-dependent methyltransferase
MFFLHSRGAPFDALVPGHYKSLPRVNGGIPGRKICAMVTLIMSPENPNRVADTDAHFAENGIWEQQGGRRQTRGFARAFVRNALIPLHGEFSLLDLGCALGDSLPIFREQYPQAKLWGCDVSANAIRRCQSIHGAYASFFQSSIEDMDQSFDVIFCSNIIEHIENHGEIVRHLLDHAKILYVMTPYMELHNGRRLTPQMGFWHIGTFDEHTFDSLQSDRVLLKATVLKVSSLTFRPFYKVPFAKLKDKMTGRGSLATQILYEFRKV